jgi:hypothetical protein
LTFVIASNLLLILLLLGVTTGGGSGLLAANTAGAAATEGRGKSEVDVLLGVKADHEGRNVDNLLADADVALLDEDTGVVDGLGEAKLVHAGLETALQEVLDLEGKDVIELHAGLIEHTDAHETANQGITLEQTLGVLLVESEEFTMKKQGRQMLALFFIILRTESRCAKFAVLQSGIFFDPHTEQHDESWTE